MNNKTRLNGCYSIWKNIAITFFYSIGLCGYKKTNRQIIKIRDETSKRNQQNRHCWWRNECKKKSELFDNECQWIAGSSLQTAPRITEDPSDVTVMRNDPATLRCSFTGDPTPEVTWYRDGEALEPRGHRLVLPDGALFFLRVSQGRGRNGGDAGTYWCVARNSLGVARSRNATLTVACKSISNYSIVNN